jgi:hypothetical protein
MTSKYVGHQAWGLFLPDGMIIGFASSISAPVRVPQLCRREHRTVLLPDYQGIGLGVRFSDIIAHTHLRDGHRYYSKTSNPMMGEYREASPLWAGSQKNRSKTYAYNTDGYNGGDKDHLKLAPSYAHEFIGADPDLYTWMMDLPRT